MKGPVRQAIALLAALSLAACATMPAAGDEASLRAVDEHQRSLVAARDAAGMAALADPDLRINAPTNTIITGTQLVAMMGSGAVAAEEFVRMPESIVRSGDIGIVMGRERFLATPQSASGQMFGARQLERRYTNIYRWRDGRWRFLARHANVIPPAGD